MGSWYPTFSRPWISALQPHLLPWPSSLAPSSHEWGQRWHQQQRPWQKRMRFIMARPPPHRPILVQGRARAMRARMAVVVVGGVGKDATVAAAINCRHNQQCRHWCSWLNSLPTTTTIAAINDCHCRCHTVDNDNCQKPEVIVCCRRRQWRSLSTEAAVNGGRSNEGLCRRRSSLTDVAVGWRDDDAMALVTMVSLANGGGGDGGRHCQLCSGG
jgi:hypothetical protein